MCWSFVNTLADLMAILIEPKYEIEDSQINQQGPMAPTS